MYLYCFVALVGLLAVVFILGFLLLILLRSCVFDLFSFVVVSLGFGLPIWFDLVCCVCVLLVWMGLDCFGVTLWWGITF